MKTKVFNNFLTAVQSIVFVVMMEAIIVFSIAIF